MPQVITQVDAFSNRPFAGNPAAVCVLDQPASDRWMQAVANEMNLAETAFLVPKFAGIFALRWFTPTVEVDLCGHATLASAHVLWESGRLDRSESARFSTRSGILTASLGSDGWITLDFPADPGSDLPPPDSATIARALGIDPDTLIGTRMGRFDLLVEVDSARVVRSARPDFGLLARIEARGVIITSRSDSETPPSDFTSRFFGPRVGVNEDPVTGSSHCILGPYWATKLGRVVGLVGYQASSRGGTVRVSLEGNRVFLGGQAVTVLKGQLIADPEPSANTRANRP